MEPQNKSLTKVYHYAGPKFDWVVDRLYGEEWYDAEEKFYNELISGNRITFVYEVDLEYVGEVSLVFDMNDRDYTIDNKRIYLSRFLVKKEMRNKGIGKLLLKYIFEYARDLGYIEMSVGVDLDNYIALMIYHKYGFDKIIKTKER